VHEGHAEHEDGEAQRPGDEDAEEPDALERLGGVAGVVAVLPAVTAGGDRGEPVARLGDRPHEVVGLDRGGVVGDGRALRRQVHRGDGHALLAVEDLLDARRARATGHAADLELDLVRGGRGRRHRSGPVVTLS
jgi:hypothetical protein